MANGPNSSLAPLLAHVLLGPTESQTFTENVHKYIYFFKKLNLSNFVDAFTFHLDVGVYATH